MGRPLKIAKSATQGTGFPQTHIGVVGGDTDIAGNQIVVRVKVGSNAEADGYIIRQKGAKKFLVSDGTNEGVCTVSDLNDSSLTADTMTVTLASPDSSDVRLEYLTNKWGIDFSGNRFALSFTDISDDQIKAGTAQTAIDTGTVEHS